MGCKMQPEQKSFTGENKMTLEKGVVMDFKILYACFPYCSIIKKEPE